MLRFHLFNQADELGKIKNNNVELHTAWNANMASKKFSLSHIKVNGYWVFGMFLYLSQKIPIPSLYSFLLKKINYRFARYAFKRLSKNIGKIFYTYEGTYKDLYNELLLMKRNYSNKYIQQRCLHAVSNTENQYQDSKTI